jgi:peroxiredoxin
MLSDEGSRTIDAYGIRNREVQPGSQADGIPYPGTFLVGTDGIIRGKLFLDGYVERHDNDELIRLAAEVLQ